MNTLNHRTLRLVALAAALASAGAQAAEISAQTDIAGPLTIVTFDAYDNLITSGPENVGAEVGDTVLLTSGPSTLLGADNQALGTNGTWYNLAGSTATVDNRFVASAFVTPRGELGFSFATPVAAVGAFFNQFQVESVANSMRVIAYDQYGNDLESYSFSFDSDEFGFNEGQFKGFARASADIYGFGIAGGTFVLDNLTYAAAVPEPGTWALMFGGLAALVALRRRRG